MEGIPSVVEILCDLYREFLLHFERSKEKKGSTSQQVFEIEQKFQNHTLEDEEDQTSEKKKDITFVVWISLRI